MRSVLLASALIALSGCAMSSAGLYKTKPGLILQSGKSPQSVATCAAETFQANPVLRSQGDHYWVLRTNGAGVPVSRWDFKPNGSGGTIIEVRKSIDLSGGNDKVRACL